MTKQPGEHVPAPSRRIYILWGIAFALLAALGLFLLLVVAPVLETREVIWSYAARKLDGQKAVAALGGPERAAAKLALYFRAWDWIPREGSPVPPWDEADYLRSLLIFCGEASVPVFTDWLLESRDPTIREVAAKNLFTLGAEARAAIPALRQALGDPHPAVRLSAASALERIRAER